MTTAYWSVPKSELDTKAGQEGYDADGIHSCCREYDNYNSVRKSPVASLEIGPVTQVILKCDTEIDLTEHYPGAISKTLEEVHTIFNVESNHWYDPSVSYI